MAPGNVSSENVVEFIGAMTFQNGRRLPDRPSRHPGGDHRGRRLRRERPHKFLTGQTTLVDGGRMAKAI